MSNIHIYICINKIHTHIYIYIEKAHNMTLFYRLLVGAGGRTQKVILLEFEVPERGVLVIGV